MQNYSMNITDAIESMHQWKDNSEKDWVDNLQDLINKKPFGNHKFYVFMFLKNVEGVLDVKKLYMQPRLTKPEPQPGTSLMKVNPLISDTAIMCWTLPHQESFGLYGKGKVFGDPFVKQCIDDYLKNPKAMMRPDPDDLSERDILEIYKAKAKGNY